MDNIENFKFKDKTIEVDVLKIPVVKMLKDYDLQIYFAVRIAKNKIKIYALFYGSKVEIVLIHTYLYITYFGNIRRDWGRDCRIFVFIKDRALFNETYVEPMLKSLDNYKHEKIKHNLYKITTNNGHEVYLMRLYFKGMLTEDVLFAGNYNSYFIGNVHNLDGDLMIIDKKMMDKKYSNEYVIEKLGKANLVECFSSRSVRIHVLYACDKYDILFEMTDTLVMYKQLFRRGILMYGEELEDELDVLIENAKFTMTKSL